MTARDQQLIHLTQALKERARVYDVYGANSLEYVLASGRILSLTDALHKLDQEGNQSRRGTDAGFI